jgi:hypothetical protein
MSRYPFASGSAIDKRALHKAISFAHGGAHAMSVAIAFDGTSDVRRDDALADARASLEQAMAALDRAVNPQPEPPRVVPLFAVACDIVGTGR